MVIFMKIINYLYNVLRFGVMRARNNYDGSILQGIPRSTAIFSRSGLLSIKGRLSSRSNSFLNACDGKLSIGKNCFINQNVYMVSKEKITIGDNVIIGPNTVIVDHDHDFRGNDFMHEFVTSPIVIEDNVWIGGNVTILKGMTIGHDSVIGAGCVLNRKDIGCIPPYSLVYLKDDLCIKSIDNATSKNI